MPMSARWLEARRHAPTGDHAEIAAGDHDSVGVEWATIVAVRIWRTGWGAPPGVNRPPASRFGPIPLCGRARLPGLGILGQEAVELVTRLG